MHEELDKEVLLAEVMIFFRLACVFHLFRIEFMPRCLRIPDKSLERCFWFSLLGDPVGVTDSDGVEGSTRGGTKMGVGGGRGKGSFCKPPSTIFKFSLRSLYLSSSSKRFSWLRWGCWYHNIRLEDEVSVTLCRRRRGGGLGASGGGGAWRLTGLFPWLSTTKRSALLETLQCRRHLGRIHQNRYFFKN